MLFIFFFISFKEKRYFFFFFFSSRRRHTRLTCDWSSDVCSSDLESGGYGPSGGERVELLVAINPGMPASPLREAASGGQLSRVMLALSVLARPTASTQAPTLAFDEIDAGIGGKAARAVGERLRAVGAGRQ